MVLYQNHRAFLDWLIFTRQFDIIYSTNLNLSDEMYHDLERWANGYIAMGIRYLQNKDLSRTILSDQIVEDNAAAIVKNITLLNRRMALLGMNHDMGNVFPAYKI